jgi:hypothetical protein
MPHDQPDPPLPPDAEGQEDVIQTQPPDQGPDIRDRDTSPLPPDPCGQEDIMSADPRDQAGPTR